MLADTVGRRSATRSRVSLRALTVRPPGDQNRMTDPATAPTSAQDHNQTRAERIDISRDSPDRKSTTGPPSSAPVSKRSQRNARRNVRTRSIAPEQTISITIPGRSHSARNGSHTHFLCAWSHFRVYRPDHTQSLGLTRW